MYVLLLWGLLGAGCDGEESPVIELDEEELGALSAQWSADPAGTAAALQTGELPEDLARLEALLARQPDMMAELCPLLSEPVLHQRCSTMQQRPHLWAQHPAAQAGERPGGGPSARLLRPAPQPEPFAGLAAQVPQSCPPKVTQEACAQQRAEAAAQQQDTERAARLCLGIETQRWRQECMFVAAEARLRHALPDGYGDAALLCVAAGAFEADCLQHLLDLLGERVPVATAPPSAWTPLLRAAEVLRRWWQPRDPRYGALAEDRLWAGALFESYQSAAEVVGNPLDVLPPQAHPHIRAAAAYRLMSEVPVPPAELAGWRVLLDAALARRTAPDPQVRRARAVSRPIGDRWPVDAPGEETIPALHYLLGGRRATSPEVVLDRQIVLLEAIARRLPQQRGTLQAVAADTTAPEVLRWTARRLLAP